MPLPPDCSVSLVTFGGDSRSPGIVVDGGCGSVVTAWFRPSAPATDCAYEANGSDTQSCTVTGATIGATFREDPGVIALGGHVADEPPCGPVTAALRVLEAAGLDVEGSGTWC